MANPIANNTSGSGAEDGASRIAILLSGTDADGAGTIDHFTIATVPTDGQIFDAPSGGNLVTAASTVSAAGADQATVYFQPNADWNRLTNFTYTATDADSNNSAAATADITVTAVADAVNDAATFNEDSGPHTIDVLANDNFENAARELTSFTQGLHGTVTRDNNGTPGNLTDDKLIYTPDSNYGGADSFTYTVTPPGGTAETATVSLTINP